MIKFKSSFFLGLILFFCYSIQAQKNIHILEAFYQALAQDSTGVISFDLEGGEFIMDHPDSQVISPKTIIQKFPDAKKYLINDSIFHVKGRFDLTGQIIDRGAGDPSINIRNIHFDYFEPNLTVFNPSAPNEIFYGSHLLFSNVKIYTRLRSSGGGNVVFKVYNSYIADFTLALVYPPSVIIENSQIGSLLLALMETDEVSIENCTINKLNIQSLQTDNLKILGNKFIPNPYDQHTVLQDSSTYNRKAILGFEPFRIVPGVKMIDRLLLVDNHFETNDQDPSILVGVSGSEVIIKKNTFDLNVRLATRTNSSFELVNNTFTSLALLASLPSTPQNYVKIDWQDLKGKLVWKRDKDSPTYYGQNDLELESTSEFNSLISTYGKLVEVFKNNRNTNDANDAYLEMKKLEKEQFKYIYKKEGGADNLFRLKLHQLLSIYTQHGTNPAQAITASVWLIFLFSIVYFFFPSDWDKKSKPQLIADFRTFVQKNEHGYFIPFLKLSKGIIISLFNAFVLSINSFVTLGFGRIPTHGFAKYICILEGFLGWFLLSIFIVSLINQVMF